MRGRRAYAMCALYRQQKGEDMAEQSGINERCALRASWGAIFAGFVTVVAVQVTLSLLGMGIGMGTLGVSGTEMARGGGMGSLAWMAVSSIVAFFIGGWVSGRLSAVSLSAGASLHGILVWGLTSMVTLFLLTSAIGSLLGGTFSVLTNMAGTVLSQTASEQRNQAGFQGQQIPGVEQPQGPQASTKAGMGGAMPALPSEVGAMMNKIAAQGPHSITPQDKEAAVSALASGGNMSREQAESTVNRIVQAAIAMQQQAGTAAKAVAAVGLSGFVLMALTALSAAWGAAAGRIRVPAPA